MGTVYLGYDQFFDQQRAIKVMKEGVDDEELRNRFLREARAAAKLDHPNIIRILDLDLDADKHPYIVMEYVEGEDLKTYIDQRRFLPFTQKLQIVAEVCTGLDHAHKAGVIHRDIKPGNIRVSRMGHAKILDFGLARLKSAAASHTGNVVGSPYYMSPEQWRGRDVDERCDVFSVAAVLYELVTYVRAFGADDISAVMTRILTEPNSSLRESLPACAVELSEIVDKGLAKDRAQRYKSCLELSQALQAFQANLPTHLEEVQKKVEHLESDFDRHKQRSAELRILEFLDSRLFEKDDAGRKASIEFTTPETRTDYGVLIQRHAYLQEKLTSLNQKFQAALPLLRLLQTGQRQFEAGELDACQETLGELLKASPGNPPALRLLEVCRHALEERRRQLDQEARLRAALSQARDALSLGNFREALGEVNKVMDLDPAHPEAAELRQTIREREGIAREAITRRAAELLETCRTRLRAKEYRAALDASRELMKLAGADDQGAVANDKDAKTE
jgi:serine/threonine protein kinase